MFPVTEKFIDSFWAKVEIKSPPECWPWLRAKSNSGYGAVKVPGYGVTSAHRIAYYLIRGDFNPALDVMHLCETRKCCNPWHLAVGTHKENMQYAFRKTTEQLNAERDKIKARADYWESKAKKWTAIAEKRGNRKKPGPKPKTQPMFLGDPAAALQQLSAEILSSVK